ncbi:hypothetical protein [Rhodococcus sp. NPDC058514]|uniref:hypothetical protein n=1 Tax=unclassified Rhodococcus (in: high G+C Gram-positive bacteria) TaxID=192944 RepID=UPI0036670E54
MVNSVLTEAFALVLRDLLVAGGWTFELHEADMEHSPETAIAHLRESGGGGAGVYVVLADPPIDRIVKATDDAQDIAIEEAWSKGAPTNWPPCPYHPNGHPLRARAIEGVPTWVCPTAATPVCAVGSLR